MSGLLLYAEKGKLQEVKNLVRAGANVNEKNEVRKLLTYFHYNVIIIIILLFVVVVWVDSSHVCCY